MCYEIEAATRCLPHTYYYGSYCEIYPKFHRIDEELANSELLRDLSKISPKC